MTSLVELRGSSEPSGPRTDHGDRFASPRLRRRRLHPALFETLIDDRAFDVLDRDRRARDAEHAGAFARSRTHASREFRKVVRLMQPVERIAPPAAIDEVVPLGDQVPHRAARRHVGDQIARVAERNSAIHAPRPLRAQLALGQMLVELVPIDDPQDRIAVVRNDAIDRLETGRVTHLLSRLIRNHGTRHGK